MRGDRGEDPEEPSNHSQTTFPCSSFLLPSRSVALLRGESRSMRNRKSLAFSPLPSTPFFTSLLYPLAPHRHTECSISLSTIIITNYFVYEHAATIIQFIVHLSSPNTISAIMFFLFDWSSVMYKICVISIAHFFLF